MSALLRGVLGDLNENMLVEIYHMLVHSVMLIQDLTKKKKKSAQQVFCLAPSPPDPTQASMVFFWHVLMLISVFETIMALSGNCKSDSCTERTLQSCY